MKPKVLAAFMLTAMFIAGGVVVIAASHFGDDDFMHTRLLPENYSVYTSGGGSGKQLLPRIGEAYPGNS